MAETKIFNIRSYKTSKSGEYIYVDMRHKKKDGTYEYGRCIFPDEMKEHLEALGAKPFVFKDELPERA